MKPVEQRLSGGHCTVDYLALAFSIFMSRDYEYEKENNNIIFGVGPAFAVIILFILVSTMQYFTVQ